MTIAPPATPAIPSSPAAPPPAPARPGARVIAIVLVVVGALVAIGTIGSAALSSAASFAVRSEVRTVSAASVSALRLDVSAVDLRVEFAAVPEVELAVTGRSGAEKWTLDTEGGTLLVTTVDHAESSMFDQLDTAVLRLPESLAGIDADLTVNAGDLDVDGEFGDLALSLGAGSAEIGGTAESIDLQLDVGEADVDLAGVDTAVFDVSIGELTADLGGGQPESVRIDASAGEVDLTVAPGEYRLTGDMTDGDLVDTDLSSSAAATSTIHADVSGADVTVSSAR